MVALSGVGVNHVVLRERTQRLGYRASETGVRDLDSRRYTRRRRDLAVQHGDALGHRAERRQVAWADLVVVQQLGLEMLAHHSAVLDFRDRGTSKLALNRQIEIIVGGQFGGLVALKPRHVRAI